MFRIARIFLLHIPKGSISGETRDFNNIETQTVINYFFPERQGAEGNLHHSEKNKH
jgi:hypothetical protein